jgi:phosphoglycerate dehydrogenase-like enzyme
LIDAAHGIAVGLLVVLYQQNTTQMKVVAYSIAPFEKEYLAKANQKKHDITLISNSLNLDTAIYAEGKNAVLVFTNDDVSAFVIEKLAGMGIKYIATRSLDTNHMDKEAAARYGIKLSNVPSYLPQTINETTDAGMLTYQASLRNEAMQDTANQIIKNLDLWQLNKCTGKACVCINGCRVIKPD